MEFYIFSEVVKIHRFTYDKLKLQYIWVIYIAEKESWNKSVILIKNNKVTKKSAAREDWTLDRWFTRPALCHWAMAACERIDV